jgi:hypothetical protein
MIKKCPQCGAKGDNITFAGNDIEEPIHYVCLWCGLHFDVDYWKNNCKEIEYWATIRKEACDKEDFGFEMYAIDVIKKLENNKF